jgi:transcriptional regulator with GAF, ATPase, and Fis domain
VIIARDERLSLRDVLPLRHISETAERRSGEVIPAARTKGELREIERETLLRALEQAGWKVAGATGAAQRLGVPPSTLTSRMKALRIERPRADAAKA